MGGDGSPCLQPCAPQEAQSPENTKACSATRCHPASAESGHEARAVPETQAICSGRSPGCCLGTDLPALVCPDVPLSRVWVLSCSPTATHSRPARSLWLSWVACPGSQLCCVSHTLPPPPPTPSRTSEGGTQLWAEGPAAHTQGDPQARPSRPAPCPLRMGGGCPVGWLRALTGAREPALVSRSVESEPDGGVGPAPISPPPCRGHEHSRPRRADAPSLSPGAVVATPGT